MWEVDKENLILSHGVVHQRHVWFSKSTEEKLPPQPEYVRKSVSKELVFGISIIVLNLSLTQPEAYFTGNLIS